MGWGELRDLDQLPPVLDTAQAAEILGVGLDHLWAMAREGTAPITPLRLGRALRWPTVPLLQVIGAECVLTSEQEDYDEESVTVEAKTPEAVASWEESIDDGVNAAFPLDAAEMKAIKVEQSKMRVITWHDGRKLVAVVRIAPGYRLVADEYGGRFTPVKETSGNPPL